MAKQPRILTGQVAAVTGAARGIGKATAKALAAQGMKVAIGDLDAALAEQAAGEVGHGAVGLALDVTRRDSFEAYVDAAEQKLGPLDVLVNNAGIMQLGAFLDEDDATAHRQVDINVHGVMYGMKIVLPRFLDRGRGHLVNIASTAGKAGFPGGATYCGTKHFVVGVSEAVRAELRGSGIEISCVMPGVVNTELAAGLKEARGVKNVNPEDVANAIVEALQSPHFDVFVPKSIGTINKVMGVLPRSGREGIARALKADQVLAAADPSARRGYELRASESEPGLAAGEQQKQLSEAN
ncbi:MAG TPA: SDR family oxidoreductase [Solirubrobacteraceae bacterium]|nr:SDR family oxidoreductase [Solirubrobacteraceae bacterium]